jgi:hypothetical protein
VGSDNEHFVKSPDKTTILSAAKFSGTTSKGLSVGLIQSITSNEFARITDLEGKETKQKIEPLTNYTIARIQKGYNAGNTIIGGMVTTTNRFIKDDNLEFISSDALTGGFDILHHWKDKEFFVDAKIIGSYIKGSQESIRALQESSAHYFQRPGADYLNYDITRTNLNGFGGKIKVGKGSKGLWRYSTGATFLSPGLELNDLGYMQTADEISRYRFSGHIMSVSSNSTHGISTVLSLEPAAIFPLPQSLKTSGSSKPTLFIIPKLLIQKYCAEDMI